MNLIRKAFSLALIWPRDKYVEWKLKRVSERDRFRLIYKSQYWLGMEQGSKSGAGSSLEATEHLRKSLPEFLKGYAIRSMLDVPCGDFFWMATMDLDGIDYIGGDIVPEIVHDNQRRYGGVGRRFEELDIVNDQLPGCDLIFSRDCLVHLTDDQVCTVLDNVRRSGAKYFASTTYLVSEDSEFNNVDRWRPLNLTRAPFNLPQPLELLDDTWPKNPIDVYKRIGVWRISDLRKERDHVFE